MRQMKQGLIPGDAVEAKGLMAVAEKMLVAARTAPKARGRDKLVSAIVTPGPVLDQIREKMVELGKETGFGAFTRDAENIAGVQAMVLLGTKLGSLGLPACGFCNFGTCEGMEAAKGLCAYNAGDLGVAVGSAVSVAADHRVDNRVMYTVGSAVVRLGILGDDVGIAYGIPLSVNGKNIFFDRR
jgi:uncharacterized ferredoxin-like protein